MSGPISPDGAGENRGVTGASAGACEFSESTRAPARASRVLAVDIGSSGAAALLDDTGALLDVVDLPTLDAGPACRPEISSHLFAAIVRRWAPSRAWVEHIGPWLGDRPASAFAFGGSKATVETALAELGVPFRTITPAVWKRAAGIPPGKELKDVARARAIERWPDQAETFARVKDHDRAKAALIGWAGIQRERGQVNDCDNHPLRPQALQSRAGRNHQPRHARRAAVLCRRLRRGERRAFRHLHGPQPCRG